MTFIGEPAPGLPFERSLKISEPLFLVHPQADGETCRGLKGNVHKATGSLPDDDSPLGKEVRRWIAIQQPSSVLGFPDAKFVPSPNWGMRNVGGRIDGVVVQSSGIGSLEATEKTFLDDEQRRLSAHYVVDRNGTVVQMVDERYTAWNAGPSEVIIELVSGDRATFSEAQYLTVCHIIEDLRTRWELPDSAIGDSAGLLKMRTHGEL